MSPSAREQELQNTLDDFATRCQQLMRRFRAMADIREQDGGSLDPTTRSLRQVQTKMEDIIRQLSIMRQNDDSPMAIAHVSGIGREHVTIRCAETLLRNLTEEYVDVHGTSGPKARKGLEGFSWALPIPDLVSFLANEQMSGTLEVTTAAESFLLTFNEGDVVCAVSDSSPMGTRLGDILIEKGSIGQRELDHFLLTNNSRGRLGRSLVESGLVTEQQLQSALEQQVEFLFDRLSKVSDASFTLFESSPEGTQGGFRMNVTRLLLESARKADEA